MIRFSVGSCTDTGRARPANEDALFVGERLFAVADGMGGHAGGEIASQLVIDRCDEGVDEWTSAAIVNLVEEANRSVVARAGDDSKLRGMGTTVTMLARLDPTDDYPDERIVIANVGDSRIYVFDGTELHLLTDDHTLVQRLVRSGALTPEQAAEHPQRNVLTRALGIGDDVLVDTWEIRVFTGDRFLLCSDGLHGELDEGQIAAVLRRLADPQEAADELVRLANEAGGHDNITVILVDAVEGEDRPRDGTGEHERVVAEIPGADRPGVEEGDELVIDEIDVGIDAEVAEELGVTVAARPADPAAADPDLESIPQDPAPTVEDETHVAERPKLLTWRVALFGAAVVGVILIAIAAVALSGRNTFSVAVQDGEVVILRGQPGGVLWIDATVEERTGITEAQIPEEFRLDVTSGKSFGSLDEARTYVANLQARIDDLATSAPVDAAPPPPVTSAP
jgi:protein phosphatase